MKAILEPAEPDEPLGIGLSFGVESCSERGDSQEETSERGDCFFCVYQE